MWVIGHSGHWN